MSLRLANTGFVAGTLKNLLGISEGVWSLGEIRQVEGWGCFQTPPPRGPARCAGLRRAARAALRSFVAQAGPDPARLPARLFRFAKVEPCSLSCGAQLTPLFVQRPLAAGARAGVAPDPCAPPPHGPSREALCSGLRANALAWRAPRAPLARRCGQAHRGKARPLRRRARPITHSTGTHSLIPSSGPGRFAARQSRKSRAPSERPLRATAAEQAEPPVHQVQLNVQQLVQMNRAETEKTEQETEQHLVAEREIAEQVQIAVQRAEQRAEAEPGVKFVSGLRFIRGLALIAVMSGKVFMLFRVLMCLAVAVIA